MKWTRDCRLGINDIDSQHRLLFAISNELLDIENPLEEQLEFRYLIDHLRNYVEEHFQFEIKFLEDNQYPDLENHLRKHKEIIQEINDILKSGTDLRKLKEQLESLMSRWIKEHICGEDKKYSKWYHQKKQSQPKDSV